MLRTQMRRNAERSARGTATLVDIERSIAALNDEDLLDLADIFPVVQQTAMAKLASAEMARRQLTL